MTKAVPSLSCLRPGGRVLLGCLLLGALACGVSKESQRAELVSRREAEFADLSQQAGMVTPAYSQTRDESHPPLGQGVQVAASDVEALADAPPR